jgi:hypothetical protein
MPAGTRPPDDVHNQAPQKESGKCPESQGQSCSAWNIGLLVNRSQTPNKKVSSSGERNREQETTKEAVDEPRLHGNLRCH